MKILIVAGFFPPYSPASASRVNKLSKFLEDQGHDVRVLCPKNDVYPRTLDPEISISRVTYTDYSAINKFPGKLLRKLKAVFRGTHNLLDAKSVQIASAENSVVSKSSKTESRSSILFRAITNIPDNMVAWYPHAVKAGRKIIQEQKPDVIFATAPPFTTLLVAQRLGGKAMIPVVYDFRDLWTKHPYVQTKGFRGFVLTAIENYLLRQAAGLVTVTQTWAKFLRDTCQTPVEFVMNGFDPADYSDTKLPAFDDRKLTLIYAGHLYSPKRDPSVLFEALAKLGEKASAIRVLFYTPFGDHDLTDNHRRLIAKHNLDDIVECNNYIPQKQLMEIQQRVDVLLLLRWDDPREDGVIAGKLFEYIGAGKPILSLGSTTGEAADIIRGNNFGVVSNDADGVADYLDSALRQKRAGGIDTPNAAKRDKFTRGHQFSILEAFLQNVIENHK